jgi:excisionase family DNA binding protein
MEKQTEVNQRDAIREKRRKEFEELIKREPGLKSEEIYRNGKRRFYGNLLFTVMSMTEDEEDFLNFCEQVLTEDDENLQYAIHTMDKLFEKIPDPKLKEEIRNNVYSIMDLCANFYIPLGAFFGQNYTIADPDVQREINDIGKRIIEEGIFPLVAKGVGSEEAASASAQVIPVTIKEKKKPVLEKGILTVEGAAARLGVSPSWVYKKLCAGFIPKIKIGGLLRIPEKDFDAWIAAQTTKGFLKV